MPQTPTLLRAALGALLDVFYPSDCAACGAPVGEDSPFRHLCARCAAACAPYEGPFCQTCGQPMPGLAFSPKRCAHCDERDPSFEYGRTCGAMRGSLRALVHALKYRGEYGVVEDMADLAERTAGYLEFLENATLVPVPLHPRRRRERGFNQSLLIARALCRRAKGAQVRELLCRERFTPTQTHLSAAERAKNVRGAFAQARKAPPLEKGRPCVLIDDVFTTGATLDACARVLRRMGAQTVRVATIAHG